MRAVFGFGRVVILTVVVAALRWLPILPIFR